MLEFKLSKRNQRYFTWAGRHLCSSVDPQSEAKKWVDSFEWGGNKEQSIFVLGVGNGYHLAELRGRFPGKSIIGIEVQSDFICPCQEIHGLDLTGVNLVIAESEQVLKSQSRILKAIRAGSYKVLEYHPVTQFHFKNYRRYRELLIGRTMDALVFQLQARHLDKNYKFESQVSHSDNELLSIHQLDRSVTQESDKVSFHLVKALRELVV